MNRWEELAEQCRVIAVRVWQDAASMDTDIRHPRVTMENHARDLDRLYERLGRAIPTREEIAQTHFEHFRLGKWDDAPKWLKDRSYVQADFFLSLLESDR